MIHRSLASTAALAVLIAILLFVQAPVSGQAVSPAKAGAGKDWKLPDRKSVV